MYAIIDISGRQERVEKGSFLDINRIEKKEGAVLKVSDVLFAKKDKDYLIGTPHVKGASVEFEVVSHFKGEKVVGLKYRRRKGYRRKVGHRQDLTRLKVKEINL